MTQETAPESNLPPVDIGTPKDEFLQSVRQALGRSEGPPVQAYPRLAESLADLEEQAAQMRRRLEENLPALLDKLADMAAKGGWKVYRAPGAEEAIGYIESLAGNPWPRRPAPPISSAPPRKSSTRSRWTLR